MPPSNSVDDDNSHADQATVDSSTLLTKAITTSDGKSIEDLMQRRLEIDRQLQALENDAGFTSGGSLEEKNNNNNNNNISRMSTGSYPSHNSSQAYRPPLQSPEYQYPGPLPTTDESIEHTYPVPPLATTGNGGPMFAPHGPTRISSSVSVGSGGTDSFNNPSSSKAHGSVPYPFSNPYDPQFLAAAVTAFHHQQQQQVASIASEASQQKALKEENEESKNASMLWKLLGDKEDELKEVRQTLRETQQKFQEQSLLATKLQTTLDQIQQAFEKERLLIKLQAEKDAQEALTSRQEEMFQKQLKWMENNYISKNKGISQEQSSQPQTSPTFDGDDDADSTRNNKQEKGNGSKLDVATIQNGELATTKSPKKIAQKQYPWNSNTKILPKKARVPKDGDNHDGREAPKITPSDEKNNNILKIPKSSNSNRIKMYPSIDESMGGNQNAESNNNIDSGKLPPNPRSQGPNVAPKTPLAIPEIITNDMRALKNSNSMNESMSSNRFDPVYVVQNGEKAEETAKQETAYSSNDDDGSLGQTVASSTYGDDRVKVTNKKLLDPYGDKGTYTGVVLRNTGMPHGLGRMMYEEDRRVFEGDWRHGRWHGYGRASFSNGDSYEGQYKFDQRHGNGIYRWNDGRIYDGQFSEDKRHGKGVFTWPDGAVYDGDFANGQRQGHGKYTFADGGQYEGSWKDGRYDGFGTCTWEDGRRYRGEWRNGMAHGRGTETYPNGNIRHEGEWVDDEPIR